MRSTIFAPKTHYDQVAEIRHADLAHLCLAHHVASGARHIEHCRLVMHEVILLKRLSKV